MARRHLNTTKTLFGQFGDAQVDKVAHELDQELEQAMRRAAD